MATTIIPWTTGSGNITLTYTGQGNGTIVVTSDDNTLDTQRSQVITVSGGGLTVQVTVVQEAGSVAPTEEMFDWVDLGLPSGLLWATYNLGASGKTSLGLLFAWAETSGHSSDYPIVDGYNFSANNAPYYSTKSKRYIKYIDGDRTPILNAADDAVTVAYGEGWRMPTDVEMQELITNTTQQWYNDYQGSGVAGMLFSNGNGSIFMPAGGYRNGTNYYSRNITGYYWSASLYAGQVPSQRGDRLMFSSDAKTIRGEERNKGMLIRPVSDWNKKHFTIKAIEDTTITFPSARKIDYSTDGGSTWTSKVRSFSLLAGESAMVKRVDTMEGVFGHITATGKFDVMGNIMSLLYGDNFLNQTLTNVSFQELFKDNTYIVNSRDLILPSNTITACYAGMFRNCTNLETAPKLPATTLSEQCYYYMFMNCTSLKKAPILPALTLVSYCYNQMFRGCTSLNYIKAMFTTTPSSSYTNSWVVYVSASGIFVKNSAATWGQTGNSAIPSGWTVQTASE